VRGLAAAAVVLGLAAGGPASAQGGDPDATAGPPRSRAVYPPQEIALRFTHADHLRAGYGCERCHDRIAGSDSAADRNIPSQARCEQCHDVEGARRGRPTFPQGECRVCHPGFDWTVDRAPPPSRFPRPNLIFSHARHLARGAGCATCHGDMTRVQQATREQLPGMAICLACHDGRKAPDACATCHLTSHRARGAPLETDFPSGQLRPGPGNPFGLDHGPRFDRNHAQLAARQREQCMACHTEPSCNRCHAGATRPQAIHPGDYLSTHMVPARQGAERCDACHRRQSFCVACHERVGVGAQAPAFRDPAAAVHPAGWMVPGPGHHGVQAVRNLGSCVACHREEGCAACHPRGSRTGRMRP
jgi:c(7)-type cytochrome triheme protein